jgi:hypothetical protein
MTNHFATGMTKAAELTKVGRLAEATALIQSLLNHWEPEPAKVPDRTLPDHTLIEGTFTRLNDRSTADGGNEPPADQPAKPTHHRNSLRETLRNIAAGGMPDHASFAKPTAPLPAGAKFITLTHGNGHQRRDFKLYIPAARPSSPMPLIVMLHGCTQSPDDFAAGTGMNALAEMHGFMVAYPAQPTGTRTLGAPASCISSR